MDEIMERTQRFPVNSRDGGLSGGRTAILPPDSKQNFVLRRDYYQEGVHGDFRRELLERTWTYLQRVWISLTHYSA